MSYIKDKTEFVKRRHSVQRLTPEEAIDQLNTVVDDANIQIAKALGLAQHWEEIASEAGQLLARCSEEVSELHSAAEDDKEFLRHLLTLKTVGDIRGVINKRLQENLR